MASLNSVSIAILLGAILVMAGIMSSLIALRFGAPLLLVFLFIGVLRRRGRSRRDQVRRRPLDLSGRLGRAGADPVRRRAEDPVQQYPDRARALGGAGDRRRPAHGGHHRAGREIHARHELDRGDAGRRGDRLDRCRGGVSADPRPRPAAAPARRRDARGRIRHQRSVRDLSHAGAGRAAFDRHRARLSTSRCSSSASWVSAP